MNYNNYCNQCKGNYISLQDKEIVNSVSEKGWASKGNIGPFQWFAAGLYYDKSVHTIDFAKKQHNANNQSVFKNPNKIFSIINNSEEFRELIRDPYVVNTEAGYMGDPNGMDKLTGAINTMLKQFFGQEGDDVFYDVHEDGNMLVNVNAIKGKDLIMSYPFGEIKSFEGFNRLATNLMASGYPNCIVALFMSKIAPAQNGSYPIFNVNDMLSESW